MWTRIQHVVMKSYDQGEFDGLESDQELAGCGDGLFRYLMQDLGPAEDCNTVDDALNRVESYRDQLLAVEDALLELKSEEIKEELDEPQTIDSVEIKNEEEENE